MRRNELAMTRLLYAQCIYNKVNGISKIRINFNAAKTKKFASNNVGFIFLRVCARKKTHEIVINLAFLFLVTAIADARDKQNYKHYRQKCV